MHTAPSEPGIPFSALPIATLASRENKEKGSAISGPRDGQGVRRYTHEPQACPLRPAARPLGSARAHARGGRLPRLSGRGVIYGDQFLARWPSGRVCRCGQHGAMSAHGPRCRPSPAPPTGLSARYWLACGHMSCAVARLHPGPGSLMPSRDTQSPAASGRAKSGPSGAARRRDDYTNRHGARASLGRTGACQKRAVEFVSALYHNAMKALGKQRVESAFAKRDSPAGSLQRSACNGLPFRRPGSS